MVAKNKEYNPDEKEYSCWCCKLFCQLICVIICDIILFNIINNQYEEKEIIQNKVNIIIEPFPAYNNQIILKNERSIYLLPDIKKI